MGNCIKKESSTQWGGEEWEFMAPAAGTNTNAAMGAADAEVIEENKGRKCSSTAVTEVKIKITKKQLEELLGKMDVQGLTVQQVLTQFIISGHGCEADHHIHRSWRPALQSIPEAELY